MPLGQSIVLGSTNQTVRVPAQEVSGGLVDASYMFWNIDASTFQLP